MEREGQRQSQSGGAPTLMIGRGDLITPNPNLKLLDQVREVMRLKHYSIRTIQETYKNQVYPSQATPKPS